MAESEIQPHPVFAQRLAALADRLEAMGNAAFAAELMELAASLTPRGEPLRLKAAALRRIAATQDDPDREFKRRNLEASHAVGMARVLEARGELGRAQELFDLAKIRAPFHYLAYAGAGYLHLRRRDMRAALEEFVQARRLNPLDRKLAVEAARVALELEDYPEALRHAIDALLLSSWLTEEEERAARRRVETLGDLCRRSREEIAELHKQRAAALQRATEHVALTRARLFSSLALVDLQDRRPAAAAPREDLLRTALDLRRFRAFRHFTDAQLLELVKPARRETFRHAQVLTREGMEERDLLVVQAGSLQVCRRTPMGTQILANLNTGDLVGELAFLDHQPRSCSLIGMEAGAVLRIPAADLDALVARHDEMSVGLLWTFWHTLSSKVRAANHAMTEIIAPGTSSRRTLSGSPGERVHLDPALKLDLLREQGLSANELRLLAIYSREERFEANAMIFAEGESGDSLYTVVDGEVRISRRMAGMGEEALTILGRGEVFGEMALVDDKPRSADARAHIQGCTVFKVDRQRLEEVLDMDPAAARQFLTLLCSLMCRRVRAMNDRLVAWRLMASHE